MIVCAAALALALGAPALAAPHVIVVMGTQPLLGKTKTAPELRRKMHAGAELLKTAADGLGLDPGEYLALERQLEAEPIWVVVPRHLDAMAWYSKGQVRVERDVIIPANTYGWETEIVEGDRVLDVYMPASCGNLSIIRRFRPHLAHAKSHKPVPIGVAASAEHAPVPSASAPLAPPSPVPSGPVAVAPPPAGVNLPPGTATPATHHFRILPWLAALGLSFWLSSGGGNHPTPFVAPPPPPCTNPCKCKP
jgi:hypothetical protein